MASRVKGIVVEIGGDTTGLDKALKDTNKQINTTQSALKDVNRLLKLDPKNTTLLAQKQRLLTKAVSETGDKLKTLQKAEKQVQEQVKKGDVSQDQYEALQREIESTKQKLNKLEGEAGDVESALKGINEKPVRDVADAADDAEDALDEAGKEASNFGDMLKAELSADGIKAIAEGLKDVAEESKEYRKIAASLKVSSEDAGYSAEETAEAYKKLYGVLGDDQTSATATANLQALHLSQSKLKTMINGTIGAWAKFGDSIPIDGLAEAVNETVKTGQVTGNLADVLNWGSKEGETFGVAMRAATEANKEWNDSVADAKTAEDFFNLALSECATETERANLVLQMLANQGLTSAGEAWQRNNRSLIESNQAQANMQEQLAKIGELVEPVFTKITNAVASVLEWFNSLDESTQTMILTVFAVIAAVAMAVPVVSGAISAFNGLSAVFSFIAANPVVLLIAAIVALVALIATKGDELQAILQRFDDFLQGVFAKDWTEVFGPVLGESINAFFATIKNIWDSIKQIFDGIIDFIRGVFTGDWERAWNGVKSIFSGIFSGLEAIAKQPINGIIGILNSGIGGVNSLIQQLNKIPGVDIGEWSQIPYLATGGEVLRGSAIVGEAGPELLTVAAGRTIVQPLSNHTTNHNSTSLGGVSITVYGAPGQDVHQLAEILMEEMQTVYAAKEVALV